MTNYFESSIEQTILALNNNYTRESSMEQINLKTGDWPSAGGGSEQLGENQIHNGVGQAELIFLARHLMNLKIPNIPEYTLPKVGPEVEIFICNNSAKLSDYSQMISIPSDSAKSGDPISPYI